MALANWFWLAEIRGSGDEYIHIDICFAYFSLYLLVCLLQYSSVRVAISEVPIFYGHLRLLDGPNIYRLSCGYWKEARLPVEGRAQES